MSLVVIFPVGKEASADSYTDFCETDNPLVGPGETWYPRDWLDAHNQRVVAYWGPGGYPGLTEEPSGGPAARADGVLQEGFDHPEE